MKKLLTFFLAGAAIAALATACNNTDQPGNSSIILSDAYYWLQDEKIPVERIDDMYYVMFDPENEMQLTTELARLGIEMVLDADETMEPAYVYERFGHYKAATVHADFKTIENLLSLTFYHAPYYRTSIGEGKLGNRFYISLKTEADLEKLERLAKEHSVEVLGKSDFLYGWYDLACTNLSTGNSLEMGNMFYETGLFDSVGYDLGARGSIID